MGFHQDREAVKEYVARRILLSCIWLAVVIGFVVHGVFIRDTLLVALTCIWMFVAITEAMALGHRAPTWGMMT